MSFWGELRRRNVVKVAVAYAIVGWLLVQVAATVLPVFEAPEWITQVFTLFVILGFPLALVLSWAYELTPQGMKRTLEVPAEESITPATGQKLNYVIIGLLVFAVGFLVVDNYVLENDGQPVQQLLPNSIAVLPFDNLSPNADDAYFAAGIHEELLNQLSKLSSLSVISRTSMLRYADSELSVPEIARELNVGSVMEGSVRYAGNRVRVTMQLIDAATDQHLWSETYDREFDDIFAIESDIAMNVANALVAEFSPEEQASIERLPTDSIEAYRLFLRVLSASSNDRRHELLDQALEIDSEFAFAHAMKAVLYSQELVFTVVAPTVAADRRDDVEALVRQHAEQALAIDPNEGSAHLALGALHMFNWRWTDAQQAFERSRRAAPGNLLLIQYGFLLSYLGQHEAAIRQTEELLSLNPGDPGLFGVLGLAQAYAKDYEPAARNLRFALESGPSPIVRGALIGGEVARGNEAALDALESNGGLSAYIQSCRGRKDPAEENLATLQAGAANGDTVNPSTWARAYLAVGDEEQALEWLEVAAEGARNHEPAVDFYGLMSLKMNIDNNPVLEQPRFVDVLERISGD
jgi:TolB-like protein